MIVPQGDRADASAKIAPFKLHRGVLPVLTEQQWIAPITTEELYHHGDPDKAVRDGTRSLYGLEEVDFTWEQNTLTGWYEGHYVVYTTSANPSSVSVFSQIVEVGAGSS